MYEDVFRTLEIAPTSDKKAIKKAYAGLVRRYHPEEYPEEWKRIHDAYERALKIAEYMKEAVQTAPQMPSEKPPEMSSVTMKTPEPEPPKAPDKEKPPVIMKKPLPPDDIDDEMDSLFQNIGVLPKEQRERSLVDGTRTFIKAATWLLVAVLSISGLFLRVTRLISANGTTRQRQYEQSVEQANRDREIMEELMYASEKQNQIAEEFRQSMIDTREKMISLYGEPDEWQKDTENPDYEKAVYHLDGGMDMKVTLYMDDVISVVYETNQDESEGE